MKVISGIIKIAATIIIVVFAILNTAPMQVNYFYNRPPLELPAFIVILGAVLFGVLLTGMLYSLDRFRLKRQIGSMKKHIKKQEDEMTRLRNIPFTEAKDIEKKDVL
ncbi:MAG: lipopolysaccharide assembly LapA domain-containing protein [Deferribacterales bacterium]|jgi:uncharacterized integral membrane protein